MNQKRKILISLISFTGVASFLGVFKRFFSKEDTMSQSLEPVIQKKFVLDFQWPTQEPFLFCVHHLDHFPQGNGDYGPQKNLLADREIGRDFVLKDGFRMYHGEEVPGFPAHPHRGFETITIVREGYVDHADSLGAAGRYGQGDVQWMTAGRGVQHSEMFPLLKTDAPNTVELFQIWLNLPRRSKMVSPHFKMLWSEEIPKLPLPLDAGEVTLIAGEFLGVHPPAPPPDSWAAQPESEISILLIRLNANGKITLPTSKNYLSRNLYFFSGAGLKINGQTVEVQQGFSLDSTISTTLEAQETQIEMLLLQAKPLGEPVVQYGPFVMNSKEEISQTIQDYQQTQFGGWPWSRTDMVHGSKIERFAKRPDGKTEHPHTT